MATPGKGDVEGGGAGEVASVLILEPGSQIISTELQQVKVTAAGFEGDRHAGMTRKADVRSPGVARGTEIPNQRQVSIVSEEDLQEIARRLGVPAVEPAWLGANLSVQGIGPLADLPAGSRMAFSGGVVLVVHDENNPCTGPGEALEAHYPERSGLAAEFPKKALHLRGVVASVEKPGAIARGDRIKLITADSLD
jgi:MOSC domain-containing protein YiiM